MIATAAAALVFLVFPGFGSETVNFDAFRTGIMPPYWTAARGGETGNPQRESSVWEIRRDPHAPTRQNVLARIAQAGDQTGDRDGFPLAIYDRTLCRDGDVSVKFKIAGGREPQTAGLVFRYQDPNNYYLLNFSVDEGRIALFRVRDGVARPIPVTGARPDAPGVKHPIHANQWYVAKVTYQGSHFRVFFGNRRLFDATDDGIRTQGKAGLWTRGGTAAEFDDFRISRKG